MTTVDVSIYVKGLSLNLDEVTRSLGTSPDHVRRKGDKKVPHNELSARFLTNVWTISVSSSSANVEGAIGSLIEKLGAGATLNNVSGIEDAYLDILLVNTVDHDDLEVPVNLSLSAESIATLARIGLSLQMSVCNSTSD